MSGEIRRRVFLAQGWKAGAMVIGGAGVWTSWDALQPRDTSGLGGVVRGIPEDEVPADGVIYVREAQTYLTRIEDQVVAIWQRCPHLGCRVAWCESAGEFECACHGSSFNRAGEHRDGPSPSGMQRFGTQVVDGVVEIDTGAVEAGPPLGPERLDEPRRGPQCTEGGGH